MTTGQETGNLWRLHDLLREQPDMSRLDVRATQRPNQAGFYTIEVGDQRTIEDLNQVQGETRIGVG